MNGVDVVVADVQALQVSQMSERGQTRQSSGQTGPVQVSIAIRRSEGWQDLPVAGD